MILNKKNELFLFPKKYFSAKNNQYERLNSPAVETAPGDMCFVV